MFFNFGFNNKTVKELRKNQGYTARELADKVKIDACEIMAVDAVKIKNVPEPLKKKITPVLRGDDLDKIPW